jgi:hypothetical protein
VIHEDIIVYLHPNGSDYVALIGEQWRSAGPPWLMAGSVKAGLPGHAGGLSATSWSPSSATWRSDCRG